MPAIPPAAVSSPATGSPATPPVSPGGGKSTPKNFINLLGSLMESEAVPVSPQQAKKLTTVSDLLLAQLPSTAVQPSQPTVIPTVLRLQLLPSKAAAKSTKEGDKVDDANQDASTQFLSAPVALPSIQPVVQQAEPSGFSKEDLSLKNVSVSLDLAATDPVPLQPSVKSETPNSIPATELAFAARLTPISAAHPSSSTSNSAESYGAAKLPAGPVSAEVSSVTPDAADQQAGSDANGSPSQFAKPSPFKLASKLQSQMEPNVQEPAITISPAPPPAPLQPSSPNTQPTVKAPSETTSHPTDSRPDIAALPPTSNSSKAEPVRDLSLRLGDGPGNQVDVRIQERAGEVHVAVLSNSSSLNSNLRDQVGDLVSKLDRAGYHAETFKVATPAGSSASSQSNTQQDLSGRQQQQQEAQQQSSNRQKRSNQNQWLQQMNGTFGPTTIEGIDNK